MTKASPSRDRVENILAFMIAGFIGVSILAIVAIPLITVFFKNVAVVPALVVLPWVGLPLAALLIIILLVIQIRSKGKEPK